MNGQLQNLDSKGSQKSLHKNGKGESTKIIIPTDLQGMAGAVTSIAEIVKDPKNKQ